MRSARGASEGGRPSPAEVDGGRGGGGGGGGSRGEAIVLPKSSKSQNSRRASSSILVTRILQVSAMRMRRTRVYVDL